MKSISNLEVFYEGSETNKGEKDNSFEKYWKHVPLPTKAKTDSDGEIGISISSHPTKADSATPQQTKQGNFLGKYEYTYCVRLIQY